MSESKFRFIILTGTPGCGKTTLIKKVCHILRAKNYTLDGFYTEEIRNGRERVGFDVVLMSGKRSPLARIRSGSNEGPIVGKYTVEVQSFESCVLPVLSLENENSIFILDEIGRMELLSHKFQECVFNFLSSRRNIILATVPLKTKKPIPLVEKIKLHPDAHIISVAKENRNALVDYILNIIVVAKEKTCSALV